MVVASFHLARFPGPVAPTVRVPFDRRALRRVDGARFAKLLGTGRGTRMAASADLRRWAIFAVWDGPADLDRFRSHHRLSCRWDRSAIERYDVTLQPLVARGSWDGADPLAGAGISGDREDPGGPVAVLTRAAVRWTKVPAFLRAVPGVDATPGTTDGLLATAGIGELPVGRQATFSLWRDVDAVRAFAYRGPAHADVIRRTRDEGWYGEEWFARFRPLRSSGTWDGSDPLG
ncbi:MAG: spheroidene monooxygenase [Acidimicrobiales bacterium]